MNAYKAGKSIRVQTEHPFDDQALADFQYELPRMPGLMPNGSRAFELTEAEATQIAFDPTLAILQPSVKETQRALQAFFMGGER